MHTFELQVRNDRLCVHADQSQIVRNSYFKQQLSPHIITILTFGRREQVVASFANLLIKTSTKKCRYKTSCKLRNSVLELSYVTA